MSDKAIESHLYVHIERKNAIHRVGQIHFDSAAPGGFAAQFQYDSSWLENPQSFALDPINLPLGKTQFQTNSKHIKLGVLMDAGPDMWGRRVYEATHNKNAGSEKELLLHGRGNGVGALFFSTSPTLDRSDILPMNSLPLIETDLARAHQAAHNVFSKQPIPQGLDDILAGSWSIGGARAKTVMRDLDNRLWIVKFSQPDDSIDRIRAEHANLAMARAVGLRVPETKVLDTPLGSVLLVERFDRTAELTRLHYASAISLVSADPENKRLSSLRDMSVFSYANVANIIRKVSPDPTQQQKELYAQMVLNVCLHNTDDHLKNIGFIESESAGPKYLSLSKSFDIVTQNSAQHYLHIGIHGREGTISNALSEPRRFGLTEKGAAVIVDRVVEVVASRRAFYEQSGLSDYDQKHLERLVATRCPESKQQASLPASSPVNKLKL
jgi:serine/threonine-protein kinase HipA